jgi:multiple sugar transport system permease protein
MVTRMSRTSRILMHVALWLFLAVMLFPFFTMVVTALQPTGDLFQFPPPWLPSHARWSNFSDVFNLVPLESYFLNTLYIAGGAMLLNGLAAIPAGYALARFRFPGRKTFLHIVVAMQMFAPIVLLIATYQLMNELGLLNSRWGLILIDATTTLPFAIWMITSYFVSIPTEIEEAAILDNAGRWRRLFDHFIPLGIPAIVTVFIFTFIISWNEFLFALTFITDDTKRPLTTGLYSFVGEYQTQWNYLMAGAILATIPVLILFLAIQRRLVSGLTAGAVK